MRLNIKTIYGKNQNNVFHIPLFAISFNKEYFSVILLCIGFTFFYK